MALSVKWVALLALLASVMASARPVCGEEKGAAQTKSPAEALEGTWEGADKAATLTLTFDKQGRIVSGEVSGMKVDANASQVKTTSPFSADLVCTPKTGNAPLKVKIKDGQFNAEMNTLTGKTVYMGERNFTLKKKLPEAAKTQGTEKEEKKK